tara:strand:- start:450 stop:575 length:126 start_codon:yes stop_codon:yes gene_type:complete
MFNRRLEKNNLLLHFLEKMILLKSIAKMNINVFPKTFIEKV